MAQPEHYRKLEHMYHNAKCNEYYAPQLTIDEGSTELIIEVQDKFFHGGNAVHGSVYFKAMDDAAFFAVNSLIADVLVLTANFQVYLLRPIATGALRAKGRLLTSAGSSFIAEAVVYNSEGEEIARGNGTFVKSRIKLTEEMGYVLPS